MSKCDWRACAKIAGLIAFVCSVSLASPWLSSAISSLHQAPENAQQRPAGSQKDAGQQQPEPNAAARIVKGDSAQNEGRPATTGDWQKDTQEALARYTYWLTWLTFALAVTSIALFALGFLQFRDSRILQRAYLTVEPLGVEPFNTESWAHLNVRNVGKLPARDVSWFIKARISDQGKLNDFPINEDEFYGRDFVIATGAEMKRSQRCNFEQGEIDSFRRPKHRCYLFVWGEVRYLDGFRKPHRFTRFCHRYECQGLREINDGSHKGDDMITAESMRLHQYGNDAS